ncbi:MAG: hypothetical protein IT428_20875 [Planctomycetaceae bacterium]|nr:hypothetical protein [Planctomycetaceae bacterium]
MRKIAIITVALASLVGGGLVGLRQYQRWLYPYGSSHCCIKAFMTLFPAYAHTHDGRLPSGESSPEASLSLLYRAGRAGEDRDGIVQILRGKTVPTETVQGILESGGLLSPETCGWHYVEGLTTADDPNIAVIWDKTPGLSHNGRRTNDGGREVAYLGGGTDWIPGDEWEQFQEKQAQLLAARTQQVRDKLK